MGDLFFIMRMSIYTLIIVLIMQIKIGPKTVEERVIQFTHKSQFAGVIQEVAEGAVAFLGVQYNNVAGKVSTEFFKTHGQEQAPGKRLQSKLQSLKNSLRSRLNDEKINMQQRIDDAETTIEDVSDEIESSVEEGQSEIEI
ncbi:MAG: hypothetical protein HRT44_03240 [Bdellovibrionales bacterium]|nr:hypothetical protein [Bdellovibrionales bacterium]NQZ18261.1 hypothetical protein [Bdellovibrionales bacterium]